MFYETLIPYVKYKLVREYILFFFCIFSFFSKFLQTYFEIVLLHV